jgi:hypothetical protein
MKRRLCLSLALAFAGFAGVALAIRTQVPWQEEYGLAAKMSWFDAHADEYDLVFLGSSRVFRGFDPQLFDVELARAGIPMRSFNLGVGGVLPFEMDRMLRAVFERRPARLKWILYEGGELDPRPDATERLSSRVVGWHDLGGVRRALGSVACAQMPLFERAECALYHVEMGAWNLSNYGQARAILGAWTGTTLVNYRGPRITEAQLDRGQGYVPLEEDPDPQAVSRHESLLANPQSHFKLVALVAQGNTREVDVRTLNLPVIREQHELARSIGARLITVVPPQRLPTPDRRALHAAGELDALLDFNLPERYPPLFTLDSRYDYGHLSRSGAIEFTRLLAERFLEVAKERDAVR